MAPKRKASKSMHRKKNGGESGSTTPNRPSTAGSRLRSNLRASAPAADPGPARAPATATTPAPRPVHSHNYDDKLFVSQTAQVAYDFLQVKTYIPERGLNPGKDFPAISQLIELRRWEEFVKKPQRGNMAVVHEFYANAITKPKGKSWVRGVEVCYSAEIINAYFKLPNYSEFQLDGLLKTIDDAKVLEALCINGAKWIGDGNKYLVVKSMPKEVKAWVCFVCSQLCPTTTTSILHRERSAAAYAILHPDINIDVGKIMSQEIYKSSQDNDLSMYFPSLITQLCRRAGDTTTKTEEKTKLKVVIGSRVISSYHPPVLDGDEAPIPPPVRRGTRTLSMREEIAEMREDITEVKDTVNWIAKSLNFLPAPMEIRWRLRRRRRIESIYLPCGY